jgi:hypothetical protein
MADLDALRALLDKSDDENEGPMFAALPVDVLTVIASYIMFEFEAGHVSEIGWFLRYSASVGTFSMLQLSKSDNRFNGDGGEVIPGLAVALVGVAALTHFEFGFLLIASCCATLALGLFIPHTRLPSFVSSSAVAAVRRLQMGTRGPAIHFVAGLVVAGCLNYFNV